MNVGISISGTSAEVAGWASGLGGTRGGWGAGGTAAGRLGKLMTP